MMWFADPPLVTLGEISLPCAASFLHVRLLPPGQVVQVRPDPQNLAFTRFSSLHVSPSSRFLVAAN